MGAIFIGIGGTGDWILTYLKDKVRATHGDVPDSIQFRLIDTLAPDVRINNAAKLGDQVGIRIQEYLQLADEPPGSFFNLAEQALSQPDKVPFIARWFRGNLFRQNLPQADFNLVRGAGQHRQFGRMGVFLNKQQILTMVRKALESARSHGTEEVPIWIVGSLAGGTGAGIFADVAALARQAARESGVAHRVVGAAVLPEVFHELRIDYARAYACLREIERSQAPVDPHDYGRESRSGQSFRFSIDYDNTTTVTLNAAVFDNLIFYNRKRENERERYSYFSQIADGLNLLLDQAVGNTLFSQWINVQESYAASFNSYRIFLPARLYERQFILEAIREVVQGLLPRDPQTRAMVWGSEQDRQAEASEMLGKQSFPVFRQLLALREDRQFEQFNKEMSSQYIVSTLLGFGNPSGTFEQDIGDRAKQAQRLYCPLCQDIENYRDVREEFEDSKTRVKGEVVRRRRLYEGDSGESFAVALKGIEALVIDQIGKRIDASLRDHLKSNKANDQALGRTIKVLRETKALLGQLRANRQRLAKNDRNDLERLRGEETNALILMDETKKPWIGKGPLPGAEEDYLNAVDRTTHWWQRMQLMEFIEAMIGVAEQYYDRWLAALGTWVNALDQLARECDNGLKDIDQELQRQTEIASSSLGPKNTKDMGGYQPVLKQRCTIDAASGRPFTRELLSSLTWQAGGTVNTVSLAGWPGGRSVTSQEFREILKDYLSEQIKRRMTDHEGMARYLEWLRDEQRQDMDELVGRLSHVIQGFVDNKPTSETRQFLLLYGDAWRPNQGKDEFLAIYNALNSRPEFTKIEHNLRNAEGINLFKDRNVIAVLATDNEIPYTEIPTVKTMREEYIKVREQDEVEWRAQAYHTFRCEQEIWNIERARVQETDTIDVPLTSGTYYRLLDEPERVRLFVKALAVGIVREQEHALGGKLWVCGPVGSDRSIQLTEVGQDLFRALVTFVQNKKDIRHQQRGDLELRPIEGLIIEAVKASGNSFSEHAKTFRAEHADLFEIVMDDTGQDYADPRKAFIALVLDYYLK